MMALLGPILDPLASYGFMRQGLLAAVVVGLVSAVLSCLLVVRHQALLGDAISHAVLLGVAIGFVAVGVEGILLGALLIAILTGVAITYLERNTPIQLDAAMGICFTTAFALGLAIISIIQPRGIDLFHVLFGNIVGLHRSDLVLILTTGTIILVVTVALFRWLHVWSFEPELAQTLGIPLRLVEYIFTALLSATVVVAMNAVGLLLVVAMLIIPGATSLLFTTRLKTMMVAAGMIGVFASVVGLYGSFYVNVASGPAIVLTTACCFGLALLLSPKHGLLPRRWRRRQRILHAVTDGSIAPTAVSEPVDVHGLAQAATLADAPLGSAAIERLDGDRDDAMRAAQLGLFPGAAIRILARAEGHQLVEVDGAATIAVPRDVASCVLLGVEASDVVTDVHDPAT